MIYLDLLFICIHCLLYGETTGLFRETTVCISSFSSNTLQRWQQQTHLIQTDQSEQPWNQSEHTLFAYNIGLDPLTTWPTAVAIMVL